jgi:hypothetical protein
MDTITYKKEKAERRTGFFQTVLEDKRQMREYISKRGSLAGFKSKNFEFAKPI